MTPHVIDGDLQIHKIKCGPYDNNAYLAVCSRTRESILIDTPSDPGELIAIASTTDVKAILITHNHMDHLLGFDEVTSVIGAPVGIGGPDASALAREPDFVIEHGSEVSAGGFTLTAIFTPGHTDGSTCFKVGNHLFTGDTLFPGGPGKSRSPEALSQLLESITSKLFTLPKDMGFYPGHGDDGSLSVAIEEYNLFASKGHSAELCGDVEWVKS